MRSATNSKIEAAMSTRENLRHALWTTPPNIARRALPIRPVLAMTQPHANRLSVSHPVDIQAQAIIRAPTTNTTNEPIASLRIQGMIRCKPFSPGRCSRFVDGEQYGGKYQYACHGPNEWT